MMTDTANANWKGELCTPSRIVVSQNSASRLGIPRVIHQNE